MLPYKFPEHIPQEPQPDWITTDTSEEEVLMEPLTLNDLLERLTEQVVAVLETLDSLKAASKNMAEQKASDEELNMTKMMLEAEKSRADAAENKLKAIMGALNG